ncbi:hypothetical protein JL722_12701 [Aureococcus anophagefferens]|nr:hypothetical protein JL722_12701 [Aureococcus anophagefferens]
MRALGVFSALALSFVGGLRPRERSLLSLAARLRGGESFWGPGDDDADAAHEESLPDHAPEDDDDDDDDEARAAKAAQRWTRRAFEAAHEGRGRSDDALPPLREAASLAPDEPRALHALGNAPPVRRAAAALEVYARALHCAPSEDFPPNAPLLNNVATILLATGERDLATASLERSLEIEPHAPGTLFNLATAKYGAALDAAAVSSQRRVALATGGRARVRAAFSSGLYGEPSSAFRDVLDLLDAAEPHAPPGSPLRERVLALRACASNRVPGRAEHAAADFEDEIAWSRALAVVVPSRRPPRAVVHRAMSDPGAEKELDTLRKLPENKQCANCGVVAQHGHGAVVMTYATFVCHTCKSSHQSFSHLCKSVSMSYWSAKEVKKLRDGGNARCRAVFMGKMDPSRGLKPGASLQATKDFVDLLRRLRRGAAGRRRAPPAGRAFDPGTAAPPAPPAAAAAPDPFGAPVSPAAGFGAFAAAPAPPAAARRGLRRSRPRGAAAAAAAAGFDAFGSFAAAPAAPAAPASGLGGFAAFGAPPPAPPAQKPAAGAGNGPATASAAAAASAATGSPCR